MAAAKRPFAIRVKLPGDLLLFQPSRRERHDQLQQLRVFKVRLTHQHNCGTNTFHECEGTRKRSSASFDMVDNGPAFRSSGGCPCRDCEFGARILGYAHGHSTVVDICRLRNCRRRFSGHVLFGHGVRERPPAACRNVCEWHCMRFGRWRGIDLIAQKSKAKRCCLTSFNT